MKPLLQAEVQKWDTDKKINNLIIYLLTFLERNIWYMVQQIVLPIKDSNILKMVQDTLLDSFRAGRRNTSQLYNIPSWESDLATCEWRHEIKNAACD